MTTSLRSVSTERLQRELRARSRCMDCGTEHSSGWHEAGENRVRCADCASGATSARRGTQLGCPLEAHKEDA